MIKSEYREYYKEVRLNISNREQKNKNIRENVLQLIENCKSILIYMSYGTEVDTIELITDLLNRKINVYVPRCYDNRAMKFHKISSVSEMKKGMYGILEPHSNCEIITKTDGLFCIVPGLCFSLNGDRMGYGKGYYDTFLKDKKIKSVGLCYDAQLCDNLPTEQHDKKMDYIITESIIKEVSFYE